MQKEHSKYLEEKRGIIIAASHVLQFISISQPVIDMSHPESHTDNNSFIRATDDRTDDDDDDDAFLPLVLPLYMIYSV